MQGAFGPHANLVRIKLVAFGLEFGAFGGSGIAPRGAQPRGVVLVGAVDARGLDGRSPGLGAQKLGETTQRTEAGQRVEGSRLGQQLGKWDGACQRRGCR